MSTNSTAQFELNLTTNGGTVAFVSLQYMIVHTNSSLTEYLYFFDAGTSAGAASVQSTRPVLVSMFSSNFIIGLTSFTGSIAN